MADKQLEQLNKEISDLNAKVEAAEIDWLSATDPHRKADLKDVYDYAKQMLPHLLEDRRALQAKEQLNKEITDLNAKVEAAKIKEQMLLHLLEDRRALQANLPGAGERTELLQSLHAISAGFPCRLTASITAVCCGPLPSRV